MCWFNVSPSSMMLARLWWVYDYLKMKTTLWCPWFIQKKLSALELSKHILFATTMCNGLPAKTENENHGFCLGENNRFYNFSHFVRPEAAVVVSTDSVVHKGCDYRWTVIFT